MSNVVNHILEFGPYRMDIRERSLYRGSQVVPVSPKAFDLLVVLTERRGQLVLKDDLMKLLWPDTFVEESNLAQHIFQLRKALGEKTSGSPFILTVPGRGYRFTPEVRIVADQETLLVASHARTHVVIEETAVSPEVSTSAPAFIPRKWLWMIPSLLVAVALAAGIVRLRRPNRLRTADFVLVSDFANTTGEPIFDDSLKQATMADLEQSPFLRVVSEGRIQAGLKKMGRPANERVSGQVAHDLCLRSDGKALLNGTISSLAGRYLIDLNAIACSSGETLAREHVEARNQASVLSELNTACSRIRAKLGESLPSVEKFSIGAGSTTSSLEALKALALALRVERSQSPAAALPFFQHAIELDPNFAVAYADLGNVYYDTGEGQLAADNFSKAFHLRDRVSEKEKFLIEAGYYSDVTGELEKANQIYDVWSQTYPSDMLAHHNWASNLVDMGFYEKAAFEALQALHLVPPGGPNTNYALLLMVDVFRHHLEDARALYQEAQSKNVDDGGLHEQRYAFAFLAHDPPEMARQLQWAAGKPGVEDVLLLFESDTQAFYGHWRVAQNYLARAIDSDRRNGLKETVALIEVCGALRAAELGFTKDVPAHLDHAFSIADNRDIEILAALAHARSGDYQKASLLADKLGKAHPLDTLTQGYWLPSIRASIELARHNPARAIALLENAKTYELGAGNTWFEEGAPMYPVYLRGQAYLTLRDGAHAADEFRKYAQYPGVVQNCYFGVLARIGLARSYTLMHDAAEARQSYRDFLDLWKDADPDLPVLNQARQEFAKL